MKNTPSISLFRHLARTASVVACAALFTTPLSAKPVPDNLGYGLDKLVESHVALKAPQKGQAVSALYNGFATEQAASYDAAAIKAEDGRYMVDITLSGKIACDEMQQILGKAFSSFEVTSVDAKYRNAGIIEGWIGVEDAAALAQTKGVRAVFLALKPHTNDASKVGAAGSEKGPQAPPTTNLGMLGTKFLQGVTQHRVDKINQFYNPGAPVNYDGEGITVGVLSDSFASNAAAATTNVNNFDLPGAATNPQNTQPVVVLQDVAASDEGRGMSEIVYKMAPKAKVGFATAFTGEVGFANNIRALSGRFPSVPNTQAGFVADVITDDVSYGGEPIFADGGVVANGVDDVAAVGVSYFSSAANSFGVATYNSDLRLIPNGTGNTAATNTALQGTNIDLTGVPTDVYQGGFHNFNPATQDTAILWNVSTGGSPLELQWDDPYDAEPPDTVGAAIFSGSGTAGATPVDFTGIALNSGQQYVIFVTAVAGQPTDAVVSLIRESDGRVIVRQDTGTDEVVNFFPPTTGSYTVRVERFDATSGGGFTINIFLGNDAPIISTDLNVLTFRADNGAYIGASSLISNNFANNRPVELGTATSPAGQLGAAAGRVQFMVASSRSTIGSRGATRIRLGTDANSASANAPAEYFDYNSAVTKGHSIAAGCNGVAAYDVFRPNIPQSFTSGGPAMVFFNRNQTLKPTPEVRLQPRMAAANGSNSTWTGGDSANDVDTGGGQFYGTSAAAPHAAAVAALVLDAHGGPGTVTPSQMRTILQNTAFTHDLDPYMAKGVARASNGGKVTVIVRSDNTATQSRGRNDPNSHSISYVGPGAIGTFVFNPNGLATEGGGVTSGQNGVDASNNYFSNVTPGLYFTNLTATGNFPFTPGASNGLLSTDATAALSNPAPAPAGAVGQGQTLTLTFGAGTFTGGDIFRFTIGRALNRGPNVTAAGTVLASYNADLFGGGVLIPEGTIIPDGIRFSGTIEGGGTFDGRMQNILGKGFSQLDGFGFVNAEAAVAAPLP